MAPRTAKGAQRICLLKVAVSDWSGNIRGQPYRVLAIAHDQSLFQLARAIVDSFEFDFDHCFGFFDNAKSWIASRECYELFADIGEESRCRSVKRTKIGQIFPEKGKKMLFLFDYGDEWQFVVEHQGFQSAQPGTKYPQVIESVGVARTVRGARRVTEWLLPELSNCDFVDQSCRPQTVAFRFALNSLGW